MLASERQHYNREPTKRSERQHRLDANKYKEEERLFHYSLDRAQRYEKLAIPFITLED
jgi:hypothetical protein